MHEDSSPPSIWRWKYVTQRLKGSVRASQPSLSSQRYHPLASLHICPLTFLVCPSIVPLSRHVFPPCNPHHHQSPSCHSYSRLMGSVCRDALFTSSRPCSPMHQTLSPPYPKRDLMLRARAAGTPPIATSSELPSAQLNAMIIKDIAPAVTSAAHGVLLRAAREHLQSVGGVPRATAKGEGMNPDPPHPQVRWGGPLPDAMCIWCALAPCHSGLGTRRALSSTPHPYECRTRDN